MIIKKKNPLDFLKSTPLTFQGRGNKVVPLERFELPTH